MGLSLPRTCVGTHTSGRFIRSLACWLADPMHACSECHCQNQGFEMTILNTCTCTQHALHRSISSFCRTAQRAIEHVADGTRFPRPSLTGLAAAMSSGNQDPERASPSPSSPFPSRTAGSARDLKARFEQVIKTAAPKGAGTLRAGIARRGAIPAFGPTTLQGKGTTRLRACGIDHEVTTLRLPPRHCHNYRVNINGSPAQ